MTKGKWTWAATAVVGGAVLVSGVAASSMAAPATRPATTKPSGRTHRKLFKPFSEMTSLTPQQQEQIAKIHEDELDQVKKLEEKQTDDAMALLTPEQQTEAGDLQDKVKQTRKEKYASKRKASAASQPSR